MQDNIIFIFFMTSFYVSILLWLSATCISLHIANGGTENSNDQQVGMQCSSSTANVALSPRASLLQPFYRCGKSAQAYRPNTPVKRHVCDENANGVTKIARNFFWRTNQQKAMSILIRGNIFTCSDNKAFQNNVSIEVWQPRPDGTYSSLRDGVHCRATLLVDTVPYEESNGLIGRVEFETASPGSPGLFGGLIPSAASLFFGDIPPFGEGYIHLLINADGHHPLLEQLSMGDIQNVLSNDTCHHYFSGPELRPHYVSDKCDSELTGGMHVRSAVIVDSKLEVDIDLYLSPSPSTENEERDLFCSFNTGYFGWIVSFFKEPISICSPSLLDYFAL